MPETSPTTPKGLKAVAILEITKASLALITGIWFFSTLGRDWSIAFEELLHHFYPEAPVPERIVSFFKLFDSQYQIIAASGFILYAILHFAEGIGLWKSQHWAEWLGVISGGIYIPFEVFELSNHPSWITLVILAINLAAVVYLAAIIKANPKREAGIS